MSELSDTHKELSEYMVISKKYDGHEKLRMWFSSLHHEKEDIILETDGFLSYQNIGCEIQEFPFKTQLIILPKKWFNVFIFYNSDGSIHDTYTNIAAPAKVNGQRISFVDLDLDVLVHPNKTTEVLDRPEFEENKIKYGYSLRYIREAEKALEEVLNLVKQEEYPFDWKV